MAGHRGNWRNEITPKNNKKKKQTPKGRRGTPAKPNKPNTPKTPERRVPSQQKSAPKPKVTTPKPKVTKPKASSKPTTPNIFKVTNTTNQVKAFNNSAIKNNITKRNDESRGIDYSKAAAKSQEADVLTGVHGEHTLKLKSDKQQKKEADKIAKEYFKTKDWEKTKEHYKKQNRKAIRSYLRDEGFTEKEIKELMGSKIGKKVRRENYLAMKNGFTDENGKKVKGFKQAQREAIEKDVKKTYNLKYKDLTSEDITKIQAVTPLGKKKGNAALEGLEKGLSKKVGKKTAAEAYKGKFGTGLMQGASYVDVFSGVGKYDKASKEAIRQTKSSKSYMAGYGAGMAAQMGVGGVGVKGTALAGKMGANAIKGGAKVGAKDLAKAFGKRRAAELLAESPTNVLDAAKMSLDENGEINKTEFAKWMAINSGFTAGMGGAIEGIGGIATKKLSNETLDLLAKKGSGKLTEEESKKLAKNIKKLKTKANGDVGSLTQGISHNAGKDLREAANDVKWKAKANATKGKGFTEEHQRATNLERTARADLNAARDLSANNTKIKTLQNKIADIEKRIDASTVDKVPITAEELAKLRATRDELSDVLRAEEKKEVERLKNERRMSERVTEPKTDVNAIAPKVEEKPSTVAKQTSNEAKSMKDMSDDEINAEITRLNKKAAGKWKYAKNLETKGGPNWTPPKYFELMAERDEINETINELKHELESRTPEYKAKAKAKAKAEAEAKELEATRSSLEGARDILEWHKTDTLFEHAPEDVAEAEKRVAELEEKLKVLEGNAKSQADFEKTFGKEGRYAALPKEEEDILIKNPNNVEAKADKEIVDNAFKGEKVKVSDSEALKKFNIKMDKLFGFLRQWESSLKGFEHTSNVVAAEARRTNNKALGEKARKLKDATVSVYTERNRLAGWIEDGRVGADRKTVGKSLNQIYDDFKLFGKNNKQKQQDFQDYLVYKHAIDRLDYSLKNPGKENYVHMDDYGGSLYSKEQYQKFMAEINSRWGEETVYVNGKKVKALDQFGKEMTSYYDDLMKYRVDMGLVTKEWAEKWKKRYPNYVPTMRDFEAEQGFEQIPKSVRSRLQTSVQTATGGKRPIQDLYSQTCLITGRAIRNGEQNNLMNLYCDALGIGKGNIPKGTTVDDVAGMMINATKGKDGYSVTFFKDGQQVTMACDKQIALGLRELNGQDYTRLLHAGSKFGKLGAIYKAPITDYNILFGLRNNPRDIQQAAVNSKSFKHYTKAMPDALECMVNPNNPYRKLYELNGGKYSALVKQGKGVKQPTKVGGKTYNPFKHIENANAALEAMPRHCEFIGTLQKNADEVLKKQGSSLKQLKESTTNELFPGVKNLNNSQMEAVDIAVAKKVIDLADADVISNAIRNSAEVTLNFSRNGVMGRALNMGFMPYFNPSIQGLSKTIRMMEEDGLKSSLAFFGKMGAITLTPAMINEITCVGNRDYQNLNDRDKDMNFLISIGDHRFLKVPKPRENAVVVEPFVYGLRHFFDTAEVGEVKNGEYSGIDKLFKPMWDSARTNLMPVGVESLGTGENLFSPLLRLAQNKTWYGGSIESVSDLLAKESGKKNSEIYDEKTSALAIWIGSQKLGNTTVSDATHMSPKKIDNLMDSYTGLIYDLGAGPFKKMKDYKHPLTNGGNGNPVVAQFVKDAVFSNKNATELWAEYTKAVSPDTFGGKVEATMKKKVFGNTRMGGFIKDKNIAAQYFLEQKGYDDMTFTNATSDEKLTPEQKRKIRIARNNLDNIMVYGDKDGNKFATSKNDPLRSIAKVIGIDRAFKDYTYTYTDKETGKTSNTYLDFYEKGLKNGESKQKLLNDYCGIRETIARCQGNKSFPLSKTVSVMSVLGNNPTLADNFTTKDNKKWFEQDLGDAKIYKKYGNKKGSYILTDKLLNQFARSIEWDDTRKSDKKVMLHDYDLKDCEKFMALAQKKQSDNGFFISSHYSNDSKMSAARYLVKQGFSAEQVSKFANKRGLTYIGKNANSPEEVMEAIKKSKFFGKESKKVQIAVYHLFGDYGCDWGNQEHVGQKNDSGIINEHPTYSGYGRGGYRRHGYGGWGGYGGRSGSSAPTTESGALKTTKVKDVTFNSNLNDAYRKKLKKLREESRKK